MLKKLANAFTGGGSKKILSLLSDGADNLIEMNTVFLKLLRTNNAQERKSLFSEMEEMEHKGDRITHAITLELSANFLTPIDRPDIHAIAGIMDDIGDRMLSAGEKILLYRIKEIKEEEIKLAELMGHCIHEIKSAVILLDYSRYNPLPIKKHCVSINSLENEAGKIAGLASRALLDNKTDQIEQIKHLEFLRILESGLDKCEQMANSLEGLITKMN